MAENIVISEDWNANDYSNIITISSAAIASVLLVIFKSRCSNIKLCCGLLSCDRKVTEDEDDDKKKKKKPPNPPPALVPPDPPDPDLQNGNP